MANPLQQLHVRNLLHRHGFRYCDGDDDFVRKEHQLHQAREDAAQRALAHADTLDPLHLAAVSATSTDHHTQDLAQTLNSDGDTFWSSTGANSTVADDDLLFECRGCALARIVAVRLGVYRAHFQHGAPLYPPVHLSIAVGASPTHMQPVLSLVPVAVTEELQTFVLPAHTPPGRYLRLTLHGRLQMQLEDGRYYVAIRSRNNRRRIHRSIEALGSVLDCAQVRDAARAPLTRACCSTAGMVAPSQESPQLLVLAGTGYADPGGGRPGMVGGLFSLLGMR